MLLNIIVLLLCGFLAESTKDAYEYVPSVGLFIKLHRIPANWKEARLRCHLEGGILASPESQTMSTEMLKIMFERQLKYIYTGIHATYSKGDYTTVTGTPLADLDVEWQHDEPDNYENSEDCLIMNSGGWLADARCSNGYPFMCHKSPDKINAHSCVYPHDNSSHSDYIPYNETGSCYKFHKEGRYWPAAFRTCQAEDAYLVIINSEREAQIIKELFGQNQPNTIPGGFAKDSASIGLTKWNSDEWFTIHGQPLSEAGYASFNNGEPNNVGNNETCISINRNGLLNDYYCDTHLTFICEKPITSFKDLRADQI